MSKSKIACIIIFLSTLFAGNALAIDCSGLPEWKRQHLYLYDDQVQYQAVAYINTAASSKRDMPDPDKYYPWDALGSCEPPDGGGGGGNGEGQPISIYGAWLCSDDYCTWSRKRDMFEFDAKNHWLIDRGSDNCDYTSPDSCPSVNLVVLSFVHPLRLLHGTTDVQTLNGVPRGMTPEVVNYFKAQRIRVMLSIGGITYTEAWNQALAEGAWQLGINAAAVAANLDVGIEIDYEENQNPDLDGLQDFIDAYRSVHEYDASGADHAARLTIDLAAGDRWLIALTERATEKWLNTAGPVLDYANAMVTPRQSSADAYMGHWQEHIDGKPQYDPPILPLAPVKLTGSLWLTGRRPEPECVDFGNSLQHPSATGHFVQTITPNGAGSTPGMLGFMFWAAECEGTRTECTTQENNNSCEGGMGAAAADYSAQGLLFPMPPLRQE